MLIARPTPRRTHLIAVAAVALVVGTLAVTPQSCGDGRPDGYHSPNLAFGDAEIGLVWLKRSELTESVMFARSTVDPPGLKGQAQVASSHARGSDTPLIASLGPRYLLAWTQDKPGAEGVYVRYVHGGAFEAPEQRLVEGRVTLCRQMESQGSSFVLAFASEKGLHLARLPGRPTLGLEKARSPAALDDGVLITSFADTAGASECRLAADGERVRILFKAPEGPFRVISVDESGRITASRDLGPGAQAAAMHAAGSDTLVALALPEGGARFFTLDAGLLERQSTRAESPRHWRGVAIAPATRPFVVWSESKSAEGSGGSVLYAFLDENGRLGEPGVLSRWGARHAVNARTGKSGRTGVTWSDGKDGSTVRWAVLTKGSSTIEGSIAP